MLPSIAYVECDESDIACVNASSHSAVEYEFCSRRGVCDFETGRCACVDGFSRANCEDADAEITEDFDADVMTLASTLNNFTGEERQGR